MAREASHSKPPADAFERYWPELRGRVPERWSMLTNDRLANIDGQQQRLAEQLREANGISEAEASRQVNDFVATHWGALAATNPARTAMRGAAGGTPPGKTRSP